MHLALGIHAAMGVALTIWSIRVSIGTSGSYFFEDAPGVGVAVLILAWIVAWWVIARRRPMLPRHEQPEARFTFVPAVVSLVLHLSATAYFLTSFTLFDDMGMPIFWGMGMVLAGVPLSAISWALAGIRFHAGTWALAWVPSILGMGVAAGVIANHMAQV